MNLCLFCVEKKGWSDNFASQSSYNKHYWEQHEGVIETKEKRQKKIRDDRKMARRRWEEEKEKAINLGLPMPKKPRTKLTCSYCKNDKGGFEGSEYDRHLIAVHHMTIASFVG